MNDAVNTASLVTQIISSGGLGIFAYLVYRLLDRHFNEQAKRDATHAEERRELLETASKERAAMLRFMGVLEERSRVASDDRRVRARTSPFGVPRQRPHDTDTEEET